MTDPSKEYGKNQCVVNSELSRFGDRKFVTQACGVFSDSEKIRMSLMDQTKVLSLSMPRHKSYKMRCGNEREGNKIVSETIQRCH